MRHSKMQTEQCSVRLICTRISVDKSLVAPRGHHALICLPSLLSFVNSGTNGMHLPRARFIRRMWLVLKVTYKCTLLKAAH